MKDKAELLKLKLPEIKKLAAELDVKLEPGADTVAKIADAIITAMEGGGDEAGEEDAELENDIHEQLANAARAGQSPDEDPQDEDEETPKGHTARQNAHDAPLPEDPQDEDAKAPKWPTEAEIKKALDPLIKRGLKVTFVGTGGSRTIRLKHLNKEDCHNVKQNLRVIVQQANLLMRPTKKPTKDSASGKA